MKKNNTVCIWRLSYQSGNPDGISPIGIFSGKIHFPRLITLLAAIAFAASNLTASAQNGTWIGGNGGDWSNNSNWEGSQIPGASGTATFNNPASTIAHEIADQKVKTLTFSNISGPVTFGSTTGSRLLLALGGTLQLSTAATDSTGAVTINAPLLLGAPGDTASGGYFIRSDVSKAGAPYLVIAGSISGGTSGEIMLTLNGQSGESNIITGLISDGNSSQLKVHKSSSEAWTLANSGNTFSGGITIENGRLRVASIGNTGQASAIGTHGTIGYQNQSGTIIYTGTGETSDKSFTTVQKTGAATFDHSGTGSLKFTGDISREVGEGSSSFVLKGSTAGIGEIAGQIREQSGGSLALIKEGTGTWIVSGTNNNYSDATSLREGTLNVKKIGNTGENSSIGRNGVISMGFGSATRQLALVYTGTGETSNKVISIAASYNHNIAIDHSGTGRLKFTSDLASVHTSGQGINTLTFRGSTSGVGEFAGAIVNGLGTNKTSVTKEGTGTWILSGASTYTGATVVSEGELVIEGSLNGTSHVNVSGQLASGVTGSIKTGSHGSVTILDGGVLAPGGDEGAGTLSLSLNGSGKLNFQTGSTLAMELGAESDRIVFSDSGNWLQGGGAGTTLALSLGSGFSYSKSYTIFENVTTANFTLGSISGYDTANYTAELVQFGDTYQLEFTAVPELGTFGLVALGAFIVYRGRRSPSTCQRG